MLKISHTVFAAASALALLAGSAQAQTTTFQVQPGVLQQAAPAPARYTVRATTLYSNDETGRDWPGSDEIYAEFVLRRPDRVGSEEFFARTTTFGDFDTGETKHFREWENCLTGVVPAPPQEGRSPVRAWDCHPNGERINMQFRIKLFEEDVGDDNLIGQRTVRWTQQELDGLGLSVGQTSTERIRLGGYTMTWEIRRVS